MATTPPNIPPAAAPVPGSSPEQVARNKHMQTHVLKRVPDPDNTDPKATVTIYELLVRKMSSEGKEFKAWQDASKEYNQCIAPTGTIGADDAKIQRASKLEAARIARIEYLAPLDMATVNARTPGAPSLLSSEEWDLLACKHNAMGTDKNGQAKFVSELTGEERTAAVNKFKKDNYGQYEDVINTDQFGRAKEEVQKSRRTFKRAAVYVGHVLGFREKTDGEKALTETTKQDAIEEIKKELESDPAVLKLVDDAIKNGATKTRAELLRIHVNEAFKKVPSEKIDEKVAEIDASKAGIREDIAHGKRGYQTKVSDITGEMEVAFRGLVVVQKDAKEYNKDVPANEQVDLAKHEKDVNKTIDATTKQLEMSVMQDYQHHARLYEERFAGAGKMSRYDAPVDVSRSSVSDGQDKALKAADENKEKVDKDGKLIEGMHLTVNGVPCANVGVVEMYKLHTGSGFSIMGHSFRIGGDKRIDHLGKFMEAWMVETTAANQQAYQATHKGEKLTMAAMLEAYASGDKLPNGQPNHNKGPNGPINSLRISTFPVSGGMEATLQAFAEMQAMAHILGIEINIDTHMIAQNSDEPNLAHRIRIEWISHKRLDDPTYGVPAMQAVEKKYGLEGIKDPVEKREKFIRALAGNDGTGADAAMRMTADKEAVEAMKMTGAKPDVAGGGPGPVYGPMTQAEHDAAVAAAAAAKTPPLPPPAAKVGFTPD